MSKSDDQLEALLEYLKRNRGFDFTGYKRASLERRIQKRLARVDLDGYGAYIEYLEVHPGEFAALFDTILINVTTFFRDPGTWKFLAEEVLPQLIARRGSAQIRVWSAGCASGEEAYTLVMLFVEAMGEEAFKKQVKVYATDVDEDALAKGRNATFTEREVQDVPEELRSKYFDVADGRYSFRKDLRRQLIFGRHDLITDAPISRVDLLVCRNTLMYLNAETQGRILARFHFALNDGGVLFLGKAETILAHTNTFSPIDLKRRISTKVARTDLALHDRLLLIAHNGSADSASGYDRQIRLRDVAMDSSPIAQFLVDAAGNLISANDQARAIFGLGAHDLQRPLHDLKISYRPVELRSLIEKTHVDRRPTILQGVEWMVAPQDVRWFDLQISPLFDANTYIGVSITFTDVSAARRLQRELEIARQELEGAYEEVQSTNEELETTNEELQSTIEELETTNEELQSTNEELETMNEELQATNEELHAINEELQRRSSELNHANAFLASILTSVRGSVVVVDTDLRVKVWSKHAEELWGLREHEAIGKHFLGLDIGLPVAQLRQPIKTCMTDSRQYLGIDLDATNRRGKAIRCRVDLSRLALPDGQTSGVIMIMEEIGLPSAVAATN